MIYWNDYTKGQFDIQEGWIGLDYAKLHDPLQAELTLFHEQTHAGLASTTEFGQATTAIYKQSSYFTHCTKPESNQFKQLFYESQFTVQEGFAVFMQVAHIKKMRGEYAAQQWLVEARFPKEYYDALSVLKFGLGLSERYKDYFTSKIAHISMLTNIRKDMVKLDLLSSSQLLKNYLDDPQNNPSKRLEQLCESLKYRKWMVTKSEKEIADFAGVYWFDPASKQEVAEYLNYLLKKSGKGPIFKAEQISDSPKGSEVFMKTSEKMIVANMNLNFTKRAIPEWKIEDFIFMSRDAEAVFIIPDSETAKDQELLQFFPIEQDASLALISFLKTGEVYMTYVSEEVAEKVLSSDLSGQTLMTKWDFFDQIEGKYLRTSSRNIRNPDLVIHNYIDSIYHIVQELLKNDPNTRFIHLHTGFMENHPFQSLILAPDDKPINIVNAFGNKGITKVIDAIRDHTNIMEDSQLLKIKKEINNVMSIWMGLYWEIDWVETMLGDKETPVFR